MHDEAPATSAPDTPTPAAPAPTTSDQPPLSGANDPQQRQMQEEYLRALLNRPGQQQGNEGQGVSEDDPMVKMLQSMMGTMSGDPNAAADASLSPDDISKVTGLPPFLTNMLTGRSQQAPPTPAQLKTARIWKMIHILVATLIGAYLVYVVDRSISTFGSRPPAPATAQNPLVLFVTSELLIHGSRIALSGQPPKTGLGAWYQLIKDLGRDGAILLFMLGVYYWGRGLT